MNFAQAFSETIGKEAASKRSSTTPLEKTEPISTFTSDDMKAYVDARFEALKSDLLSEMQVHNKVETPQENMDDGTKNQNENQNNEEED